MRWLPFLCALGCAEPDPDDGDDTDVGDETDGAETDSDVDTPTDSDTDDSDGAHSGDTGTIAPTEAELLALGPSLWLRADDLGVADRDPVPLWTGPAGSAEQAHVDRQPILRTARVNGLPAVRFDGDDDRLDLSVSPFARANGSFTVVLAMATQDTSGHVIGTAPSNNNQVSARGSGVVVQGGRINAKARDADAESGVWLGDRTTTVDDGAWRIVSAVMRPRAATLFVDGAVDAMSPTATERQVLVRSTMGAADGDATGGSFDALDVDIAEVFVFPGVLDACGRWAVEAYLSARYGIAVQQEVAPPHAWHRAADLSLGPDAPVATWPAVPTAITPMGPAVNSAPDQQPHFAPGGLGGAPAVRFDGVDDRLDLPQNLFEVSPEEALTLVAAVGTSATSGHLVGSGPSVPGGLLDFGTALYVDSGTVFAKSRAGVTGLTLQHPTVISDGSAHVISAAFRPDGLGLRVDGDPRDLTGTPVATGFGRAAIGASDGAGALVSVDPLQADLGDLRMYRYALDTCALDQVERALALTFGVPMP